MVLAAGRDARQPAAESHVPAATLTSFALMAVGATLMAGAVFGTELVREPDARFTWARLGIAGFGLLALLAGLAWFCGPDDGALNTE